MRSEKKKKADLNKIDEASFKEEVTHIDEKDVEIIFQNEEKIHRKVKRKGPLKKYIDVVRLMFSMVKDYKQGTYREVPWNTIASIALVLLYVLNPLDIIPDFLPVFGLLDDASVLALALKLIKNDLDLYAEWKRLPGN
ncbi:MAG: DUF1232 domain-containing protein [Bacteroidia bacterium]|nr:DUF1232 domain-containing protein [Bacteroidia bacterium]NNM24184.1 DUF1232 domain-containing protein [Flavobacteriaceae bacterium]